LGLILGGILTTINWRLIFLVSVPVGLFGTVWAYLKLKEQAARDKNQRIDWWGNGAFAIGLTLVLLAASLGLSPYKDQVMGWSNPLVIGAFILGTLLLIAFVFIEFKVPFPMFNMRLFNSRVFSCGNFSRFLCSLAQGGLQFMLIIWFQGIWLPLHGYSFEDTPLWSAIYMLPLMGGFFICGPLCGKLSDKYGSRAFTTLGMCFTTTAFILLTFVPADFNYPVLACILFLSGSGMGMFAAPNTSAVMGSVPAAMRGVSSGMRSTFQNTGSCVSMALYFAILIYGMAQTLPGALRDGLSAAGVGQDIAAKIAAMPPSSALFAAFLGYNPIQTIVDPATLAGLPAATKDLILGEQFFPKILSPAVISSLDISFHISAGIAFAAMIASFLQGGRKKERGGAELS